MNSFTMQVAHIVHEERLHEAEQRRAFDAQASLRPTARRVRQWLRRERHNGPARRSSAGAGYVFSASGR